ncbi:hypothetical protein KSP40_PGU018812 [Platanthera guangdongensis]|uniref:VAN3-binding protein-like auxin canalisation domain-containing protein n=1 Tax=Platanthera guangdongensis TaxID=2320717 RepID=A0ABR2MMA2_9ASPA
MAVKRMKMLLTGALFKGFIRGGQIRRKENLALCIAEVHASLAVARLAAAVVGTMAKFSMEPANDWSLAMPDQRNGVDREMGLALASAAVLVATILAEAAEEAGAERSLVAV